MTNLHKSAQKIVLQRARLSAGVGSQSLFVGQWPNGEGDIFKSAFQKKKKQF